MKLNLNALGNTALWKGYELPRYDIGVLAEKTRKNPVWIHFGAGNIFRMFPAELQQRLINEGDADRGIIVCESFDEEIIDLAFTPYDNLTLGVTLKANGEMKKTVIGSIVESLAASRQMKRLEQIFGAESLQMVSFTITEKGYDIGTKGSGYFPWIKADIDNEPSQAKSTMGIVAYLAYTRYLACPNKSKKLPLAFVSMDNCSQNGDKLKHAIVEIARAWFERGVVDQGFIDYLNDASKITFPLTMIDKITPRPAEDAKAILEKDGLEDADIFRTKKNTYVASFVNAEETGYLVIEDAFPNGRPVLEKVGVLFTNRGTVEDVEKMKVGTCLNPLHTVLAIYGCLLNYKTISEEMTNENLRELIKRVGYNESLPAVVNPGIIDPKRFINEVICIRFPNPYLPDTPQRIACDCSAKIPVRFGGTLKTYITKGMDVAGLKYIPLVFAAWLRYLIGVDDFGNTFEPSPDPQMDTLRGYLKGICLGDSGDFSDTLRPILSDTAIFGVDLYSCGLADKVCNYFAEMISAKGAVAAVLKETLK